MDDAEVERWFREYLEVFEECGRGEREARALLSYYGVPLLLSTDDVFVAMSTDDDVVAMAEQQVQGMLAANYHDSEVLDLRVTVLNANSALCEGTFSRRRDDGSEIARLRVTYVVAGASAHRRISVMVLHSG